MRWLRPYTDIDYVDSGWFSLALFVFPACWLQLLCAFCGNTSAMQCRLHTVSWYHNKSLPYALCNMTDFVCIYHSVWSQHMFLLIITCVKLAVNYFCFCFLFIYAFSRLNHYSTTKLVVVLHHWDSGCRRFQVRVKSWAHILLCCVLIIHFT